MNLKNFTSIHCGGEFNKEFFAFTNHELIQEIERLDKKKEDFIFLGEGTNTLISSKKFNGELIVNKTKYIAKENEIVRVDCGLPLIRFIDYLVSKNLSGATKLYGIPGTLGGALFYNSGAFGSEISDYLYNLMVYDRKTKKKELFQKEELEFGYRTSLFQKEFIGSAPRFIALHAFFIFKESSIEEVQYTNLNTETKGSTNLNDIKTSVRNLRNKVDTVLDNSYYQENPNRRSLGSFFKNPVVDKRIIDELPKNIRVYDKKVSASDLVKEAGFHSSMTLENGVGISESNNLVLINKSGNAKGEDILSFANKIIETVFEKFKIKLEIEPTCLNF